jgi:lysozyme
MIPSKKAYELIIRWEGFRAKPYLCSAGVWTIGYGTTYYENGKRVTKNDPAISEARAMQILCYIVEKDKVAGLNRYLNRPVRQHQFDALTSFVYNVGLEAFRTSTMLRLINKGDMLEAAHQFDRWVFADGKKSKGLMNRRKSEKLLFLS